MQEMNMTSVICEKRKEAYDAKRMNTQPTPFLPNLTVEILPRQRKPFVLKFAEQQESSAQRRIALAPPVEAGINMVPPKHWPVHWTEE